MTTDVDTGATPALQFRNFKGGDYRARGPEDWQYRVRRMGDQTWTADERRHAPGSSAATEWQTIAAGLPDRATAEAACAGRDPSARAKEEALVQLRQAVAARAEAQARLAAADDGLANALRGAFSAGHSAGPLVPITGLTRNRLYQIRDGRRT